MKQPQRIPQNSSAPSFDLDDLFYLVFRRKWIFATSFLLAVVVSVAVYFLSDTTYSSQAKIMIRYVMEDRDIGLDLEGTEIRSTSDRDNIINAEMQIMTSQDVLIDVARSLTNVVDKIVKNPDASPQRKVIEAAQIINQELSVSIPMRNNVVRLEFLHPDPTVPQEILDQLVKSYLVMHSKVHNDIGDVDDLKSKAAAYNIEADNAEREIQRILQVAQVTSIQPTREMLNKQISAIQLQLTEARANLAEHNATKQMLEEWQKKETTSTNSVDEAESENFGKSTENLDYQELKSRVDSMKSREAELLVQYTPSMIIVQNLRNQINELESKMIALNPGPLLENSGSLTGGNPIPVHPSVMDPQKIANNIRQEISFITSLQAKVNSLTTELSNFTARMRDLDRVEEQVLEFKTKKEMAMEKSRFYTRRAARADSSQTGIGDESNNISILQHASFPEEVAKGGKFAAGAFFIIFFGVVCFVFVWDLILRSTVNRPEEVESKLDMPLFMPIPEINQSTIVANKLRNLLVCCAKKIPLLNWRFQIGIRGLAQSSEEMMEQFCEDLRDHLVGHFAIKQQFHKPKLVALTSSLEGSGTSALSSGLAKALSKSGQGKVLLVDLTGMMQSGNNPKVSSKLLELQDLLKERRENLDASNDEFEVATAFYRKAGSNNGENDSSEQDSAGQNKGGYSRRGTSLPAMIHSLIPKFSNSDYDYVIFDMPTISHSSITTRLVGLMDHTLLVIPSGRVTIQTAKIHKRLLDRVQADTSVVLNRYTNYLPWKN